METLAAVGGIGAAFGLSSSAGLNAYIPLLLVALAGRFPANSPLLKLDEPYSLLTSWWVIGIIAVLLAVEVLVDKFPVADSINDGVQTFIRPAAGAILFAANADVITDINPIFALAAGLFLAGSTHVTKGAIRPIVTATTGGTGNWLVSAAEDVVATVISVISIVLPLLALFILFILVYLIYRYVRRRRIIRESR